MVALGTIGQAFAQDALTREQVLQDLQYLTAFLEETHPDPYTAFGGGDEFRLRAQALEDSVPDEGLGVEGFYRLLRPLFAQLGDGHTYVSSPRGTGPSGERSYLPLRFRVATDAVFISDAWGEYEALIGMRLETVQGRSLEELSRLASEVFPTENEFGAGRRLVRLLASDRGAWQLLGEQYEGLALGLVDADDSQVERRVPFALNSDEYSSSAWRGERWSALQSSDAPFFWQFIGDRRVAYFRVRSIVGREPFEELRSVGRSNLRTQVERYYQRYLGGSPPEYVDSAIAGVPSLTEATYKLLEEMKDRGARYLIVDLRDNGGGWSSMLVPFYYLVFGDRYFEYEFPISFATRVSPAYLSLMGTTLDGLNRELDASYEIGDMILSEPDRGEGPASRQAYVAELQRQGHSHARYLADLNGDALYTPELVVLINTGTFSAAYHFEYHLWHLGATLVGVPSAQAGNAFVDVTEYELPNSGLRGSVARTRQIMFPDDPELARTLTPHFPMVWEDYRRFDFDAHAEVRYALDLIESGRVGSRRDAGR
jgi:hypothetical protein